MSRIRIAVIADGRSPLTRQWLHALTDLDIEVETHLISTYPVRAIDLPVESVETVPVGFSRFAPTAPGTPTNGGRGGAGSIAGWIRRRLRPIWWPVRSWLAPLDVLRHRRHVARHIEELAPDLVHAMRIPYEGMLGAEAVRDMDVPFVISVWGNDLTLFAKQYPTNAIMTRRALRRADALLPDCQRDLELACEWGFDCDRPARVVPGTGGTDCDAFRPRDARHLRQALHIPPDAPVVLNPRGLRGYVRTDVFLESAARVLRDVPEAVFIGLGLKGSSTFERMVDQLDLRRSIRLLGTVERSDMPAYMALADVCVSPSEYDGTPNTLLETMAAGAFPISGDIQSVREWIRDGENGYLCPPRDVECFAAKIVSALRDPEFRERAAEENRQQVILQASRAAVRDRLQRLYLELASVGTAGEGLEGGSG